MEDFKHFSRIRRKLFVIVFGTNTPGGKLFDIVLLYAILFSIIQVMLESVPSLEARYGEYFDISEWTLTILFTIEYATRLFISRKPMTYARSFFGVVDLLAILPTYVAYFAAGGEYLVVIRAIRLLRVFRILKLSRYIKEAEFITKALVASRYKIFVFLGAVFTLCIITGTLMYLIEGGENGFTSIPKSIYWTIVTITTVGYGDIAPHTVLGQTVASVVMLMGYAIIAVPTGIVSAEMALAARDGDGTSKSCPTCGKVTENLADLFCVQCGTKYASKS